MNSREIVQRTLNFDHPERVARSFGDSDFVSCRSSAGTYATEWEKIGENKWKRIDEWGNTWGRIDPTSKGEVTDGVLDEISKI